MTPVIAIVGRPNVGKSTLFNRLVGRRSAIVHDRPGVTRDRHYDTTSRYGDREILLVDTGGFEPRPEDTLFTAVRDQALAAVEEADVVLFVVDARAGMTPADEEAAEILRRSDRPVLLVANKCDNPSVVDDAMEFHALGFDELFDISAEHNHGVGYLMDKVLELLPMEQDEPEEVEEVDAGGIRIAVLGKPNVGKSTLVNRLLGEDRQVVTDIAGTTMDAIDVPVEIDGIPYTLVDTAGVRRRSRIGDMVEGFAVSRAIRTIERCHVTLLMIDASHGPSEQDARLASLVIDRGRCLIVLLNKWDLVKGDPERNIRVLRDELERKMPHTEFAPTLQICAQTGKGCHLISPTVQRIYQAFDKRLTTAECNRFLEEAVTTHSVPQRYHRPVRLNYMTQVRVRPPSFVIWSNTPEGVDETYKRYLQNRLRKAYGFEGTPLRIDFKKKRRPGEVVEED